jgi:pteridine reductase
MAPKVALITGAARRIGAATAAILHENGMNVVLHYNTSRLEAEELCASLNKIRENSAATVQGDLAQINILPEIINQTIGFWGHLDVLVNNASRYYATPFGSISEKTWDDLMDSNVKSQLFLSQAAAPFLKETEGCIVNLVDIHAERPMCDYAVYCISKAGIFMLTKMLAKELGPTVRVNGVSPGPIVWPEEENSLSAEMKYMLIDRTTLKRQGNPGEVAKAVLYLAKDADYITGQIIRVDGGRSLSM